MTTDRNEAFAAEKREQVSGITQRLADNQRRIADYDSGRTQAELDAKLAADVASGKIEMIGTDRYRVLTGFDFNETFSVQRATRPGELSLVLPEHGLDMSKGYAALYSRQPEWHKLGNAVPEGISDVEDVMRLGGVDFDVLEAPAWFFGTPLSENTDFINELESGNPLLEVPGKKVTYRSDTHAPLGVVGKDYTVFQNAEAFRFLQDMTRQGDILWESVGATRGGAHVFVSMRLPEDVTVDIEGVADIIRPFVALFNSHDGSMALTAAVTPWRPVCGNTERLAVKDAHTKWTVRHTKNAKERTDEAARTLKLSGKYFRQFAAEETQLAQNDMLLDEFDKLLADLWPAKLEPTDREKTIATTRRDLLVARFKTETSRVGHSAYAAERAVTGYLDHDITRKAGRYGNADVTRATAMLEGSSDEVKSRAHQRLMLRVR